MTHTDIKKNFLIIILSILSIFLGVTIAELDLYGFVSGSHSLSFLLLIYAVILSYCIAIAVFLLDFADDLHSIRVFSVISVLFGLMHLASDRSIGQSFFISLFFFGFLLYTYRATYSRSKLLVTFKANEIFLPVVKKGLLFLMGIFAVNAFLQTQGFLSNGKLSPQFVNIVSTPVVSVVNKQLGQQLQAQLGDKFKSAIGTTERKRIVQFVLSELIESMSEGQTRQFFGFRQEEIPLEKTVVYDNGEIDIAPVVRQMLPKITDRINKQYGNFIYLLPFGAGLITVILISSTLWPFHFIASLLVPILFTVLLATKFISKSKRTAEVEKVSL